MRDSEVKYLTDAGPLVGAFWPADQWHRWSQETLVSLGHPVYTTESVFAEAAHHLKNCVPALLQLLAAVDAGLVRFVPVFPAGTRRAAEILSDYPLRADWSDASLIFRSERYRSACLITINVRDFTVDRRLNGTPVPCVMPPC